MSKIMKRIFLCFSLLFLGLQSISAQWKAYSSQECLNTPVAHEFINHALHGLVGSKSDTVHIYHDEDFSFILPNNEKSFVIIIDNGIPLFEYRKMETYPFVTIISEDIGECTVELLSRSIEIQDSFILNFEKVHPLFQNTIISCKENFTSFTKVLQWIQKGDGFVVFNPTLT